MARVLIQAGHSGDLPPFLAGGGGAPGEAAWATDLAGRLHTRLREAGVECVLVGAWLVNGTVVAPPPVVRADYDLFLSIHYDAAVYGAGKNTGAFADRAAKDPVGARSDVMIREWEALWRAAVPIPIVNARRNANTKGYYAFRDTSARTPGVIIEHGCGSPVPAQGFPPGQDSAYLRQEIEHVADVDARAVLRFLGITPGEEDEVARLTDDQRAILETMTALNANAESIATWINKLGAQEQRITELEALAARPAPRAARVEVVQADGRRDGYLPEG
jgi:hypothetical protein